MKTNVFYLMSIALTMLLSIGVMKTEAQVTIGKSEKPAEGALLDLKQQTVSPGNITATKGLLYPRVELTVDNELYPMFDASSPEYNTPEKKTAAKRSHIGLTVYNVGAANGFVPGLHVWDGTNWVRPITKLPEVQVTRVNSVDLRENYTIPKVGSSGAQGDGGDALPFNDIIIPETGSYAFSFRLYGELPDADISTKTGIFSLSIWATDVNYANRATNLRDIAEIDLAVLAYTKGTLRDRTSRVYTYSITLGGYFTKGEHVKVKMTAYNEFYVEWKLRGAPSTSTDISAARTSMLWWQL